MRSLLLIAGIACFSVSAYAASFNAEVNYSCKSAGSVKKELEKKLQSGKISNIQEALKIASETASKKGCKIISISEDVKPPRPSDANYNEGN